jgi:hypothetical protein
MVATDHFLEQGSAGSEPIPMRIEMTQYDRRFRMWDYRVSHDQMLLRSPKSEEHLRNQDLVFVGVQYLELPTMLKELALVEPKAVERERVAQVLGRSIPEDQVFVLSTGQSRFLVVAAAMRSFENDLSFLESSLESFP